MIVYVFLYLSVIVGATVMCSLRALHHTHPTLVEEVSSDNEESDDEKFDDDESVVDDEVTEEETVYDKANKVPEDVSNELRRRFILEMIVKYKPLS